MTAQESEGGREEGGRAEHKEVSRAASRCALRVACVQKFESYKIIFNKINNGGQGSASGKERRGVVRGAGQAKHVKRGRVVDADCWRRK